MNKAQALSIIGGLSAPSKMPGFAYGLPVANCITGARMALIDGSICSDCYAAKGFALVFAKTVDAARLRRLESLNDPQWVPAMVRAIGDDEWFRWLDSGDLQSVAFLEAIAEVCRQTPKCRHWLPTREFGIVAQWIRSGATIPANLIIRLSAMFPDKPVTVPASLRGIPGIAVSEVHSGETVTTGAADCPARRQGNKCAACRACWDRAVPAVSYHQH